MEGKYKGIELLEYYLSEAYPSLEEVAIHFNMKKSSVSRSMHYIINKYLKVIKNTNVSDIPRSKLIEILNKSKESKNAKKL